MSAILNQEYTNWISELKSSIKNRQIKAAIAVNSNLILMYWDLGKQISEKQQDTKWGTGFIDQLSNDLKSEFPEMVGFSRTNLFAIKKFYLFYSQKVSFENVDLIIPQLGGLLENDILNINQNEEIPQVGGLFDIPSIIIKCCKIPWKHNLLIIEKSKDKNEVVFYINQTIENNWSRAVLEYQIETNLYDRQGKAITNFKSTLPAIESDLAKELLKDPYNFEFIALSGQAKEKDLEQQLIVHVSKFLLELGKGFAYMGRQYLLKVGTKEYRTDLLFYHTKLKCYIVIELKFKDFEPEFVGKLNFYVSAVNELVKDDSDKPTIGILLCKTKDNFEVEFALKDINKPIGVSEFNYTQLPEEIKNELPTMEQFEFELNKLETLNSKQSNS
jgi:predicted nuclease of restriction endonuclease-like (RecB) superfamily